MFAFVRYHGNAVNKPLLRVGRLLNITDNRGSHSSLSEKEKVL
jgi:hypothetical protein